LFSLLALNGRAQIQQGMDEVPVQGQTFLDAELATAQTDPVADPYIELLHNPRVLQKASITERQLSNPRNQYASVERLIEDFQRWQKFRMAFVVVATGSRVQFESIIG
jgi:hypothetical protein